MKKAINQHVECVVGGSVNGVRMICSESAINGSTNITELRSFHRQQVGK